MVKRARCLSAAHWRRAAAAATALQLTAALVDRDREAGQPGRHRMARSARRRHQQTAAASWCCHLIDGDRQEPLDGRHEQQRARSQRACRTAAAQEPLAHAAMPTETHRVLQVLAGQREQRAWCMLDRDRGGWRRRRTPADAAVVGVGKIALRSLHHLHDAEFGMQTKHINPRNGLLSSIKTRYRT